MKVTMLTSLSGGYTVSSGDVVEFEDAAEAKRLVEASYAEAADPKAKVTLTVPATAAAEVEVVTPAPVEGPATEVEGA